MAILPVVDSTHWHLSVTNPSKAPTVDITHHQNMRSRIQTFQGPGAGRKYAEPHHVVLYIEVVPNR
jgi:hypothetical protein